MTNESITTTGGEFHALTQLKKGEKYTLLTMSQLGIGAVSFQITVEGVKVGRYAQYEESVQLIFKRKGKRKLDGLRFHGSKSCAIRNGWIDLYTDPFTAPRLGATGFFSYESRYVSFDQRYMTNAIVSAPVPPIFTKLT